MKCKTSMQQEESIDISRFNRKHTKYLYTLKVPFSHVTYQKIEFFWRKTMLTKVLNFFQPKKFGLLQRRLFKLVSVSQIFFEMKVFKEKVSRNVTKPVEQKKTKNKTQLALTRAIWHSCFTRNLRSSINPLFLARQNYFGPMEAHKADPFDSRFFRKRNY